MSETNFSYMEVSAKRKKRNQFISILIIVAIVLLGVIVWGWIELQENSKAERIKNALNSQVEPAAVAKDSAVESNPDTAKTLVKETVPVPTAPAATVSEPAPVEPKAVEPKVAEPVEAAPAPKPKPAHVAKTHHTSMPPPAPKPEPVVSAPPPEPIAPPPAPKKVTPVSKSTAVTPSPAPTPAPIVAAPAPAPPAPSNPSVPSAATHTPAKAYPPEDLPSPAKPEATEDVKLAMVATPVGVAIPKMTSPNSDGTNDQSANFKTGVAAYQQQDYVNAIHSFGAIPKPASKKRGSTEREEFVQGNFLKGLSLLKVGHMSEAVSAFQNVLEFEKYYPLANMNLGICYVELKQYAKAHQAFEAVVRDQSFIDPAAFDDVMQRTKYFWALAWTRLYKNATNADKQNFFRAQAIMKWKDYEVWFSKNEKYKSENLKAENYLKSLSSL